MGRSRVTPVRMETSTTSRTAPTRKTTSNELYSPSTIESKYSHFTRISSASAATPLSWPLASLSPSAPACTPYSVGFKTSNSRCLNSVRSLFASLLS